MPLADFLNVAKLIRALTMKWMDAQYYAVVIFCAKKKTVISMGEKKIATKKTGGDRFGRV